MTVKYNVKGTDRKELVKAVSDFIGEDYKYLGAPTMAYSMNAVGIGNRRQMKRGQS